MDISENLIGKLGTFYKSVKASRGNHILLQTELVKIQSGHYQSIIQPCRIAYKNNKSEYLTLKSKLPAITFSGTFDGSHSEKNLVIYNELIVIDIDKLPEIEITEIKSKLESDQYVVACWVSPSGHGLKILFQIKGGYLLHKFNFDSILRYLYYTYKISADTSGSDHCRLCYVSDDPKLIYNGAAKIFYLAEERWRLELIDKALEEKLLLYGDKNMRLSDSFTR